jgi:hypothetical protein
MLQHLAVKATTFPTKPSAEMELVQTSKHARRKYPSQVSAKFQETAMLKDVKALP